jgi:hypothetical protein
LASILARPPTTHPYWASEPPVGVPCSRSSSPDASLPLPAASSPHRIPHHRCETISSVPEATHHTLFFIPHLQTLKPSHINTSPPQTPPVNTHCSPPSLRASRGHRSAAMTKETLDSDRVNYLIWRYVFARDPPTRFFRYERFSLTVIASQVSLGIRFVHVDFI